MPIGKTSAPAAPPAPPAGLRPPQPVQQAQAQRPPGRAQAQPPTQQSLPLQPATPARPLAQSSVSDPLQTAAMEFYTTWNKIGLQVLNGKLHLPVMQPGSAALPAPVKVAAPAASPPAPAKAAPTAGGPGKQRGLAASPPAAPPAKPERRFQYGGAPAPFVSSGDPENMTRTQLGALAQSLGIVTRGVKAEDLRVLVAQAQAGGGAAPAQATNNDAVIAQMADEIVGLVDENYDMFADYITPGTPADQQPEGYLGCGGDCVRCPNPEAKPGGAPEQIMSCYYSVHESLNRQPTIARA